MKSDKNTKSRKATALSGNDGEKEKRMTSRERVRLTLEHEEPDRVPLDLGSSVVTGIHASTYSKLKEKLGISEGAVKVFEPLQMLAKVEEPVRQALGIDLVGIYPPGTIFGYLNENWKPFTLFDGTEVLISGNLKYKTLSDGSIIQYPQGDESAPPSGRMPREGYYFDIIPRQEKIDEINLDPKKWVEQTYFLFTDEDLRVLEEQARWYYGNTEYALFGNFGGGSFGDIAIVMGPHIPFPVGIRDQEEWYISHIQRREHIRELFSLQMEIGMKNIKMYHQAVGERIEVIEINGNDFGSQNGPLIAPEIYRDLYKPFHAEMNRWVHENTNWKTFFHTCGSLTGFLEDFIEAEVDILNPVQISASGNEPSFLKSNYGSDFVFWGGGIDPQRTLPFGSPGEVRKETKQNMEVFKPGGGFVCNNVHNIQAKVPIENVLSFFESAKEYGAY